MILIYNSSPASKIQKEYNVYNNIDPKSIIESLDQVDQAFLDAKPVEEDSVKIGKYNAEIKPMNANTATENLHEIFYAVALAYIIQNKNTARTIVAIY